MKSVDQLHESAIRLCAEHGVTIQPYGCAWWLISNDINRCRRRVGWLVSVRPQTHVRCQTMSAPVQRQ